MERPEVVNFRAGVSNPRLASPQLLSAFGLDSDADAQMASESHSNQWCICEGGNAVLIKVEASFGAGQVVEALLYSSHHHYRDIAVDFDHHAR